MAWMLLQAIRPFASAALGFTWSASPPTATSRPDRTTCTGPAEIEESFTCLGQNLGLRAVLVNVAGIFTALRPLLDIYHATWGAEMNVSGHGF